MRRRARGAVNVVVVAVSLLIALPAITLAERLRRGLGRRTAVGAIRLVSRLCGVRYRIEGRDHLRADASYVLVANHASPMDIPALLLARPDARFLAASELFRVPLLASTMRALGAIPIDRARPTDARRRLDAVISAPLLGSYVAFAEGGIPGPGEHRRFKSGAFALAIATGTPVVPVHLGGSDAVLPRGSRIGVRPGCITVVLHPPIETTGAQPSDRRALRDRVEGIVRSTPGAAA